MIFMRSLISATSFSEIPAFFSHIFSIVQIISSFIACPIALRIAESCWIISRTHASSSIICITHLICPSIRRSLSPTRFFCVISLIFIVRNISNIGQSVWIFSEFANSLKEKLFFFAFIYIMRHIYFSMFFVCKNSSIIISKHFSHDSVLW